MRKFKDSTGYEIGLFSIKGDDSFAGILEGSAYTVRRMRLTIARREMERKEGVLYWGLDEFESELSALEKNTNILPPRERWEAYLGVSSYLDYEGNIEKHLSIHWYQEGGDPMEYLGNIIGKINFLSLCVTKITGEY